MLIRALGLAGLVAGLIAAGVTHLEAARRDDALLLETNARWNGARCTLLFDISIKKKSNSKGWSRSVWIVPGEGRKVRKGTTAALFWVSDRTVFPGGVMGAGTTFVATGWAFEKPKKQEGLFLELRLNGSPVEVRFDPCGAWGKGFDIGDLRDIDRWVRMDIIEVAAADELLIEASVSPSRNPPPVVPAVPSPPAALPDGVGIRVLGTTTEPLSVLSGETVILDVTYEVLGVPPGNTVEVFERRVVLRDGRVLTTLEAQVQRGSGTHRSKQSLKVPASLEPGVLELRASVSAAGVEASGEALFKVR